MITFALILLVGLLGACYHVTLADNNWCHTVWAGQCVTERHWQAGHCYANNPLETCDAIYGDAVTQSNGESTPANTSGGGAQAASANQQQGNTGQSQQSQQTQSRQLAQPQGQQQQQQQNQQQNQNQNQNQNPPCTPSVSFSGLSGGTYSFSVSNCGKAVSPVPSGSFWGEYRGNASGDGCWVYLYEKTDSNGNLNYNQLWWSAHDRSTSCTSANVSVS